MRILEQTGIDPAHVAANVAGGGAIAFSWFAVLTQFASLIAVGLAALASIGAIAYYVLAILNDHRVKRWRNERRLRKIAYLKARIVGLEAQQIFDDAIALRLPAEALPEVIKSSLQK
jgi:hypothetical protein